MAYVHVEVDLDEFETTELVEELVRRIKSYSQRKRLKDNEREVLINELRELNRVLHLHEMSMPVKTIDDESKVEIVSSVWDKYTSWEFEKRLK